MQKKITGCLLAAISFCLCAHTQGIRDLTGPVYAEFESYGLKHADVFSFAANQAALSELKTPMLGVSAERKFMLAGLDHYTMAAVLPAGAGAFGFVMAYAGQAVYHATGFGLAYGRSLGKKAAIGVQFNYSGINIAGYGNISQPGVEAGMVFHITDQWSAGFHISNPVQMNFNKHNEEKAPSVYAAGLGFNASDIFFIGAGIEKEEDEPVTLDAGMEYRCIPQLSLRAGISTATSSSWFGVGFIYPLLHINITMGFNPQLGISPGLQLVFTFNRAKS